tara:strand:- start:30 stop:407 length:378 start_codon:yes stop_codon:yes gene_type:complete
MTTYIVYALLLALIQIWIIPMVLNQKNMSWMLSSRDEAADASPLLARARRASSNLQESLPAFLALALLSMIVDDVDVSYISGLACWWLIFRVGHGISYLAGIAYVRTLFWFGSIGSLIMMALALV